MATQNNNIAGSGYGNPYLDSLIAGCGWSGSSISYTFNGGGYASFYGNVFFGYSWTQNGINAFTSAFNTYSTFCNLTFVNSGLNNVSANMGLWSVDNATATLFVGNGALGGFYFPDGTLTGYPQLPGGFNWQTTTWNNLTPGSDGYITILHEIGHALGLAHPHDGGNENDKTKFSGVSSTYDLGTYKLNQQIFTIMSYNRGWNVQPSGTANYGESITPMAFDIAALQVL